jgi:FHA domain
VDWLEPWWGVAAERPDLAAAYERELRAELGPDHPLFRVPLAAVGKHDGSDDVLFRLLDGSGGVALVRLTWGRHPEPPYWPSFESFPDADAFAVWRMRADHEQFRARRSPEGDPPRGSLKIQVEREAPGRLPSTARLVVVRGVRRTSVPSPLHADVGSILFAGSTVDLGPGRTVFGRDLAGLEWGFPDAVLIHLPVSEISRQHAVIARERDIWTIEGLSERGYVRVNEACVRARSALRLRDNDTIRMGRFAFIFRDPGPGGVNLEAESA